MELPLREFRGDMLLHLTLEIGRHRHKLTYLVGILRHSRTPYDCAFLKEPIRSCRMREVPQHNMRREAIPGICAELSSCGSHPGLTGVTTTLTLLPADSNQQCVRVRAANIARVAARVVVREGILLHIDRLCLNPLRIVIVGVQLIETCRISPHPLIG